MNMKEKTIAQLYPLISLDSMKEIFKSMTADLQEIRTTLLAAVETLDGSKARMYEKSIEKILNRMESSMKYSLELIVGVLRIEKVSFEAYHNKGKTIDEVCTR